MENEVNDDKAKEVKDDIGEMLKSFGEAIEDDPDQDKKDDLEGNDDPADDKDPDKNEDKGEGEPDDKKSKGDEDEDKDKDDKSDDDKDDSESDDKDKLIESLRTKLAEAESSKDTKDTKDVEDDKDKDNKDDEPPLTFEDQDFVGELDIEELIRDPKEFNKMLNSIYQKAVTDTRKVLGEGVLRSIPDIVKTNIAVMTNLKNASEKFYEDNEDLVPFKKVVAAVFEEVASENPDKKYDEVLSEVGTEVRKRLDLQKKAVKKDVDDKGGAPKLPRRKGKSGEPDNKPDLTPMQEELASMNDTLRR